METFADYLIKNKRQLGHWDALLEEWLLCIERFSRITEGDVPYWYNERANIGVLAGAAWRCGRIALEEFQYEKIDVSLSGETDEDIQKNWAGRCDLWISSERAEELIEAKFRWINMRSDKMIDIAQRVLDDAVRDATNTKGLDDIKAIGVAFLPVYTKANKLNLQDNELIHLLINETINNACKIKADAIAWCFPKRLRQHVAQKHDNYLPGVIVLAKTARQIFIE